MNLIDELGNDLAIAFLVEKKYSKKLNPKEIRNLLGTIRETLRRESAGGGESAVTVQRNFPTTDSLAVIRGN